MASSGRTTKNTKKSSPRDGEPFLVQSNIDDFLKPTEENNLQTKSEKEDLAQKETPKTTTEEKNVEQKQGQVETIIEEQNNTDDQRKKLDEAEQTLSKRSSKKSKIINLIFFFLNIAVVAGILFYQISKESFVSLKNVSINVVQLLIACGLFVACVLIESLGISYLLKQSIGKWRFGIAYKVTQVGKYYDCVTPMSTGGQPFQITYLKSRGVPLHTSLSIPLAKYVFNQIGWLLISLMGIIVSFVDESYGTFVSIMSIIGFALSFIVLSTTVFLSLSKSVGKKIVVNILKLLHKMKIVKNYDKQYEKITKYISDFQDVMKQYAKSPKDFLVMLVINILVYFLRYSIPFFVVGIFVPRMGAEYYVRLMVMTVLVDLSASFFPMPGGTGLNEISFTAAFGGVIEAFKSAGYISESSGILIWVLLVWRFFSYYVYLLQGVAILSYDITYGNRKYKWLVVKENLAEESAVFKQEQINKFRQERAKRRKSKQKNVRDREYL